MAEVDSKNSEVKSNKRGPPPSSKLIQLGELRTSSETEMSEPAHPSLIWANDFLLDNGRRPT